MRRLLFLVGAIVFVDTMFFAALTPLLPHYSHELGLSKAHAGMLAGAYPAGCLVGAIPGGLAVAGGEGGRNSRN
jgi:MFS family permease